MGKNVQTPLRLSNAEARRFVLAAHDLLGPKIRGARQGTATVLERLKAIQVDAIDVAGTTQDIALQSRVAGYTPAHLDRLLYQERGAFEYWLKCLCILPASSLKHYRPQMQRARSRFAPFLAEHRDTVDAILREIRRDGPRSPGDFADARHMRGGWTGRQRIVKRALEVLWETGDLMIHHRKGRQRYYDLSARCLRPPRSATAYGAYQRNALLDLYSGLRLFSPRGGSGETWQFVRGFRAAEHAKLEASGVIVPVSVEGSARQYFMLAEDLPLLDASRRPRPRVRLLAPLDSLLWDARMVKEVFGFDRLFEVYKKPKDRRFGYYCLPILYGTELVGRCDLAKETKTCVLNVKSVHFEEGFSPSDPFLTELAAALSDHRRFLGMDTIALPRSSFPGKGELRRLLA